MNYPNPCDRCGKESCDYRKCEQYLKYVRTIWKQFNGYPIRLYRAQKVTKSEKFVYEHPDVIRRYLKKGPCENCQRKAVCETVCPAYWRWRDARMKWFRRKLNR